MEQQKSTLDTYDAMKEKAKEIYSKRVNFLIDVNEEEIEIQGKQMTAYDFHDDIKRVCIKNGESMSYIQADNFKIVVDKEYEVENFRDRKIMFVTGSDIIIQDLYMEYIDAYQYDDITVVVEIMEFEPNFINILTTGCGRAYPFLSYKIKELVDGNFSASFFVNYDLNEKYLVYSQTSEDYMVILEKAKSIIETLEPRLDEIDCFMRGNGLYLTNGEIFTTKDMNNGSSVIARVEIARKNGDFEVNLKEKTLDIVHMFENKNSAVMLKTGVDNIYYDGCMMDRDLKNIPCYVSYDDINNIINLNNMAVELHGLITHNFKDDKEIIKAKIEIIDAAYAGIENLINNGIITPNFLIYYYGNTLMLNGLIAWYGKLKEVALDMIENKEEAAEQKE